jgi:hypothetical protein
MAEDSTSVPAGKVSPLYRTGDIIIFKYEGNVRAEVTGHQVLGGKVWLEARAADLTFLVPAQHVVGTEPKEVG